MPFTVELAPSPDVQATIRNLSPENAERAFKAAMQAIGSKVVRRAQAMAPKGPSGSLRNSYYSQIEGLTVQILSRARYALWIEKGTGIHGPRGQRIVPVRASALAWKPYSFSVSVRGGTIGKPQARGRRTTSYGQTIVRHSVAGIKPQRPVQRSVEYTLAFEQEYLAAQFGRALGAKVSLAGDVA